MTRILPLLLVLGCQPAPSVQRRQAPLLQINTTCPNGAVEVGPGKTYTRIGDVPWPTLAAGTVVCIYYQATPYNEKWNISSQGTSSAHIVVRGIPGPNGELPIIEGAGAHCNTTNDT